MKKFSISLFALLFAPAVLVQGAVSGDAQIRAKAEPSEIVIIAGNPENRELVITLAKMLSDGYQFARP